MSDRTTVHGLQVANELHRFIEDRVLPAAGVDSAAFWKGFDAIVADLAPKNASLLAERDRLQVELDTWHKLNPGPITDMPAYRAHLEKIGYLLPQPADVQTTTANVDAELALQAGPQLVVPILNARYALNAANARWGSLYDALYGTDAIPETGGAAGGRAQVFASSPSGGGESMHIMYLMAIAAATRTIDLSSAYFVPDELTIRALVAAMRRGVRLRVITPGPTIDASVVRRASRASWGPLLEAGAEISEYQPTMFHCKVFTVDGLLVSVGSTNFDNRSFRLNDEANLNIYDAAFAARETAVFEADLARSKRVTHQAWLDRPLREKALEHLASLLSWQL